MDWIHAAQDKDKWRTIVNTVMNLGVLKSQGISWLAKEPLASQEGLNSIDLVFQLITEFVIFSKRDGIPTILNLFFRNKFHSHVGYCCGDETCSRWLRRRILTFESTTHKP